MNEQKQLALAIALAAQGHVNQVDKGGSPYILHPIKVMRYIRSDDMQLMAIAIMHDLVEDTPTTIDELRSFGFSERVVNGVDALTKKEEQSEQDYMLCIAGNYDAVQVKLADLRHNSDVRRLKGLTDKDLLRMKKYHTMYKKLELIKANYQVVESF